MNVSASPSRRSKSTKQAMLVGVTALLIGNVNGFSTPMTRSEHHLASSSETSSCSAHQRPAFTSSLTHRRARSLPSSPASSLSASARSKASSTRLYYGFDDPLEDAASDFFLSATTTSAAAAVLGQLLGFTFGDASTEEVFVQAQAKWQDVQVVLTTLTALYGDLPPYLQTLLVWSPALLTVWYAGDRFAHPPADYRRHLEPYARGEYDPNVARAYYRQHPGVVLRRLAEAFRLSNRFLLNLFIDKYIWRDEEKQRPKRAQQLLEVITQLGPTAIKIGQALSVRQDLIPEEYAASLATLQDRVPPFDSLEAAGILQRELGFEKFAQLDGLEKGPVASASIGQVYRVKIAPTDGTTETREYAVKVQRPNALSEIALDLFLVRELAPIYKRVTRASSDLQGLANEWGRGFIAELDYRQEAYHTTRFTREMKARNLNAVCAPTVIPEFSTERVLVTEWVEGTRIDQAATLADAQDIPRLCSVALNAYLVMLLELQSLHCDPHPGNLLRTPDGRLCILDFGMTLEIDPRLQYSLLEYVAHLTAEDYDCLPDDLVKLGFLKQEKLEFAKRSGVLEPLKYFLKQAGKGGGAERFRERIYEEYRTKYPGMSDEDLRAAMRSEMQQQIQVIADRESVATGLTVEVEELQRANRDSFRIPEWFLYTSRAFLTLEGVSLQADENYSLIKSCFPYVAKRLVEDDDPRARKALRDLLYGAGNQVDVKRLADLADGFSSYTTTTKTVNKASSASSPDTITGGTQQLSPKERQEKLREREAAITLAKDSADIILNPKGNLVQSLLVEESALAASARFKDGLRTIVDGPEALRSRLPFGVGSFLPPLPFENTVKAQLEPFAKKTEAEQKAQELAEKIGTMLPAPSVTNSNDGGVPDANAIAKTRDQLVRTLRGIEPEEAALVLKELRENVPKYAPLVGQLGSKFASTLLQTASMNIESTLAELEQDGQRTGSMVRVTAKGLSSVAQRGASAFHADLKAFDSRGDLMPQVMMTSLGGNSTQTTS